MAKGKTASARRGSRRSAPQRRTRRTKIIATTGAITVSEVEELEGLRRELERLSSSPLRWNADPDDVQRSVAHLVLTLVEFIRKLLERQAIRRMACRSSSFRMNSTSVNTRCATER